MICLAKPNSLPKLDVAFINIFVYFLILIMDQNVNINYCKITKFWRYI